MNTPEKLDNFAAVVCEAYSLSSTGTARPWEEMDPDVRAWWRRAALAAAAHMVANGFGFESFAVLGPDLRVMLSCGDPGRGPRLSIYPPQFAPAIPQQRDLEELVRLRARVVECLDCPASPLASSPEAETVGRFVAFVDSVFGLRPSSEGV